MSVEAHAQVTEFGRFVEVILLSDEPGGRLAASRVESGDVIFQEVEEGVRVDPLLRLPMGAARSLYTALAPLVAGDALRHDHARQDYLHERERVDTLQEALIEVLRANT